MYLKIAALQVVTIVLWWLIRGTTGSIEGTVVSCTLTILAMIGIAAEYIVQQVAVDEE